MTADRPRLALFGLFGGDNIGNEATLVATAAALRSRLPDAALTLVSDELPPAADAGRFDGRYPYEPLAVEALVQRFRPARFRGAVRAALDVPIEPWRRAAIDRWCRDLGLLLVPGTGIADDFGQEPQGIPRQLRRWCVTARERGVPVRFASVGAGPVADPLSRRWFADALRCADFRSFRDARSAQFARSIGVDTRTEAIAPDLVFGLPLPSGLAGGAPQWPPRSVGVGVMGYSGWNAEPTAGRQIQERYLEGLRVVIGGLLERGCTVRLLIGNRRRDPGAVDQLRAAFPAMAPDRLMAVAMSSYRDVLTEIDRCDALIATRFHNLLFGFLLGRPAIAIGYATKIDDLMQDMGLGAYCHAADGFEPALVLRQFDALAAAAEPPVATLVAQVSRHRQTLESQYDRLVTGLVRTSDQPRAGVAPR